MAVDQRAERGQRSSYDPHEIEARWRAKWEETGLYKTDLRTTRPKFYNLMEFPYPSGEGLHVGHVYTYSGADTYGRFQRMRGHEVFQPMGFDSFGIHTENYALKVGENPMTLTDKTVRRFRDTQMKRLGGMWDWSHEVVTSHPSYYRWTQWVFLQIYKAGLAYRKVAPVVWCPSCLTVLANEQTENENGTLVCERCKTPIVYRDMEQWFFAITRYADRLIEGLKTVDWPQLAIDLQTDWIGRSEGALIRFPVADSDLSFEVFTTRPDTLWGATFAVLAPEHPLVEQITSPDRRAEVDAYVAQAKSKTEAERSTEEARQKTGVFIGAYAVNPATGERIPIWIADYVLMSYGTGTIMGVPAHDQRDFEFARAVGLPIRAVFAEPGETPNTDEWEAARPEGGVMVNSGPFDGTPASEAIPKVIAWLEEKGIGKAHNAYKLRDWLISRQRYWGPPIPMIHCPKDGWVPVPEEDLPVILPEVEDFRPTGTGVGPLAALEEWVNVPCPVCGGPARRETDVSDTFLDSAWYFLRYPSTEFDDRPFDPELTKKWLPVDMYSGGIEHVRRHHLYARFVTKVLHDLGYLPFDEPFAKLRLHGLLNAVNPVTGKAEKMSKSRGNVVTPDEYLREFGADVLRLALLFAGPYEEGGAFREVRDPVTGQIKREGSLGGIIRFLERCYDLVAREQRGEIPAATTNGDVQGAERIRHRAIKAVTEDIEDLKFHTAIARLMEYSTWLRDQGPSLPAQTRQEHLQTLTLLLAPLAPHLAEELWSMLGQPYSVHTQEWPAYDEALAREDVVEYVVQVNGKPRDKFVAEANLDEARARSLALESPKVQQHLGGREPVKVIYVPGKLINLVVR
ncbi:MAG TPA: leucine--tRNA ligase [Thermomicrobiales bacterium]